MKKEHEKMLDELLQHVYESPKPIPENIRNIKSYLYRAIAHDVIDSFRRVRRSETLVKNYAENIKTPVNKPSSTNAFYLEAKISKIDKSRKLNM